MKAFRVALAACVLQAASARADVSVVAVDGRVALLVKGAISPGDADAFRKALAASESSGRPLRQVFLNSRGGSLREAFHISLDVKAKGMSAVVPPGALCASACFLPFAAASPRYFGKGARVGLHEAYTRSADGTVVDDRAATALMSRYLLLLGVPYSVASKAAATSANEMSWLSPEELAFMNARPWAFPSGDAAVRDLALNALPVCRMRHLLLGKGTDGEAEFVARCARRVRFVPDAAKAYALRVSDKIAALLYRDDSPAFVYAGSQARWLVDGVPRMAKVTRVGPDAIEATVDGKPLVIHYDDAD